MFIWDPGFMLGAHCMAIVASIGHPNALRERQFEKGCERLVYLPLPLAAGARFKRGQERSVNRA